MSLSIVVEPVRTRFLDHLLPGSWRNRAKGKREIPSRLRSIAIKNVSPDAAVAVDRRTTCAGSFASELVGSC